jgi:hypothetical protein
MGLLGGDARDPRAPTINAKKRRRWAPLGGGDGDLGVPIINTKKHQ